MAKQIKFTKEEVAEINQLRQDVSDVFTRLGQLQVEKKRRIDEITAIEDQMLVKHSELVEQEQKLFSGLNEKYGDGNYDPTTNTFTPSKEKEEVLEETKE